MKADNIIAPKNSLPFGVDTAATTKKSEAASNDDCGYPAEQWLAEYEL